MAKKKPSDRLKEIRKDKGLTQTEFADIIGMTQTTLSGVECKKPKITGVTLNAVEYKTGVKKEWLKTGKGKKYLYAISEKTGEWVTPEIAIDKDLHEVTCALNKIPRKLRQGVVDQVLAFINLLSKTLLQKR